jgi:hypothetical protein
MRAEEKRTPAVRIKRRAVAGVSIAPAGAIPVTPQARSVMTLPAPAAEGVAAVAVVATVGAGKRTGKRNAKCGMGQFIYIPHFAFYIPHSSMF